MLASTMNSRGCTLPPYPAPANTPHWWRFPAPFPCRAKVRFHVLHSNKDLMFRISPMESVPLKHEHCSPLLPHCSIGHYRFKEAQNSCMAVLSEDHMLYRLGGVAHQRCVLSAFECLIINAHCPLLRFLMCFERGLQTCECHIIRFRPFYYIVQEVTENFRTSATKVSETLAVSTTAVLTTWAL